VQHEGAEADPKLVRAAVSFVWPAVEAVIRELQRVGIPNIVAPYKAEAQLALLARKEVVWAVATVDSDLIVYGTPRHFEDQLKDQGGVSWLSAATGRTWPVA